jgi:hypothetical protein
MLDWAKIQHHDPRHMLAICGTCHTRCTNGEIDYKAQVEYKTHLKDGPAIIEPSPRIHATAGSVNLFGDMTAGSGKEGPGGHIRAEGGTGRHGASGGDVNAGPGHYKAGNGGKGPGGDIILKGGDAE